MAWTGTLNSFANLLFISVGLVFVALSLLVEKSRSIQKV